MGMDRSKKVKPGRNSKGSIAGNSLAPGRKASGTNVKSTHSNRKNLPKK